MQEKEFLISEREKKALLDALIEIDDLVRIRSNEEWCSMDGLRQIINDINAITDEFMY